MKRRALQVALGFALVLVIAFGAWRGWLQWRLAALEAELRAAGWPVSVEEFDAKYAPGDKEATKLYEAAELLARTGDNSDGRWKLTTTRYQGVPWVFLTPATPFTREREEAKRFLSAVEPAVALMEAAVEDPLSVFRGPQGKDVGEVEMQYIAPLETGANALLGRCCFRAADGDLDGAVRDAVTLRRLSDLFQPIDTGASVAIRYGVRRDAMEAVRYLLNEASPTAAHLDALAAVWIDGDESAAMRRAWEWRFSTLLTEPEDDLFQVLRGGTAVSRKLSAMKEGSWVQGVLAILYEPRPEWYWLHEPGDLIQCYGAYRDLMTACDSPPEEWASKTMTVGKLAEGAPIAYLRTQIRVPGITTSYSYSIMDISRSRVVRTALAAARYRLDHGQAPDALADLVPDYLDEIPCDPHLGRPLGYKSYTINGAVIFIDGQSAPAEPVWLRWPDYEMCIGK